MHWVEPQVFLIGETAFNYEYSRNDGQYPKGLLDYLEYIGASKWRTDGESDLEEIVEVMGRGCYKSFGTELNANITRVREGNKEYLQNIINVGHGSVLEHGFVSFQFCDVSRVFCYDEETEVLTDEGWKLFQNLTGTELIGTVNPNNNELEYQKPTEYFSGYYNGDMYQIKSKQVDLLVTPNHRMWVQKVDTQKYKRGEEKFQVYLAEDILHKRVRYQKTANWNYDNNDNIYFSGTTITRNYIGKKLNRKLLARFMGYYLSEGSLGSNSGKIQISQKDREIKDDIIEICEDLGFATSINKSDIRISSLILYEYLKQFGKSHEKFVPEWIHNSNKEVIWEFLEAYINGDGSIHHKNNHIIIYTSSKKMADDLQILSIKIGLTSNIKIRPSYKRDFGSYQLEYKESYIVSFQSDTRLYPHVNHGLKNKKYNRFINNLGYMDKMIQYTGFINCVQVPNGLMFVRRNGIPVISGNTHELVRHRTGVAISQESLRFVRADNLGCWVPSCFGDDFSMHFINNAFEDAEEYYKTLLSIAGYKEKLLEPDPSDIDQGLKYFDELPFATKKEYTSAARRVLPIGMATNIGWSANVRALRHIIEMRTDRHSEEEIRLVFAKVGEICQKEFPKLFSDYQVEEINGIKEFTTENRKV